jgi:Putative transposase/Transposase zinc-binding domain
MSRPLLELAEIIAAAGHRLIDHPPPWFTWLHLKVLGAIERCRTAAIGGHLDRCSACGYQAISYNSCRNRHCPKCQGQARDRWLAARRAELLPVPYAHIVFTLPHQLAPLALQNKQVMYSMLFRCSAQTLLEIAADPKHLGAEIGFFSALHTWNQKLQHHPHVHCVVPAGGLSQDHEHWKRPRNPRFFLPEGVLSEVFRGKFLDALWEAHAAGQLVFHGMLRQLAQPKLFRSLIRQLYGLRWVAYCKPPFGGPDQVLRYLGAYTHRVAISNHRLISFRDDQVTFRWRDSAHKNKKRLLTLPVEEFLRRFLLHVLPRGFVRIRHFGFLASRRRGTLLPLCERALSADPPASHLPAIPRDGEVRPASLWRCPLCGAPMALIERLTPVQIRLRSPPKSYAA